MEMYSRLYVGPISPLEISQTDLLGSNPPLFPRGDHGAGRQFRLRL
jgi:hypothetical protein